MSRPEDPSPPQLGAPERTHTQPPKSVATPTTMPGPPPTDPETLAAPNSPAESPESCTIVQTTKPTMLFAGGLPEIPGYELEGEIARGGMGRILAARDLTLGRDVAIKVLLPDRSSDHAIQRFIVESKVTARLPHPAIPPIYELGTLPDGSPFLVMKLIRGRTLADELNGTDRTTGLPRLVQIFEQIAQAVGFAHSQGVIHRDLKPANVMVGAFGEVQVMDWGLARVGIGDRESGIGQNEDTEHDRLAATRSGASDGYHTEAGHIMGTPAYMAPEQARGESVGPPADVFALGGILCAILTDHPPFLGETVRDTLRLAGAGEMATTFSRLDACGADAELVALAKRLLSPKVADRPADGKAVADEVAAYRAGVEERLRRAETERAAAEARAAEEANTRREADARILEQRKKRRVQMYLVGALVAIVGLVGVGAWWQDRQTEQRKLAQAEADARNARSESARLTAEAEAERQLRDVRERLFRNRTAAEGLLARVEGALKGCDSERAGETFKQAETRIGEGGADDLKPRLARCRTEYVTLRELDSIDNERWKQAEGKMTEWTAIEPRFAKAFASHGITPGTTTPEQASQRINESFIRERLLTSLEIWFVAGGRDANLCVILSTADPDDFRNEARATYYQRTALRWAFRGKSVPASQPIWFAIAHGKDHNSERPSREQLLLTAHRTRPNNFHLLMALGGLREPGDRDNGASAGWHRAALAIQPQSVVAWNNLGNALHGLGDVAGAITAYREAIRLDSKYALAHSNLGNALHDSGDVAGAIAACKEAIRLDPKEASAHHNLGKALGASGDVPGAIAASREAIRLDPNLAPAHYNLGIDLKELGDIPGAIAAYREAIRLDPNFAPAHYNLGIALRAAGNIPAAITAYKDAIRVDPKDAKAHSNLGNAYLAQQQYPEAVVACKEAIRLDPTAAPAHSNLGAAYFFQNQHTEAIAAAREAIKWNPKLSNAHAILGMALQQTGDLHGARVALSEAARLDPKRWGPMLAKLPELAPTPREVKP